MGGFERPILHGLCTYGMAAKHALQRFGGGAPAAVHSIKVCRRSPCFCISRSLSCYLPLGLLGAREHTHCSKRRGLLADLHVDCGYTLVPYGLGMAAPGDCGSPALSLPEMRASPV